jgi:hypothetical protein
VLLFVGIEPVLTDHGVGGDDMASRVCRRLLPVGGSQLAVARLSLAAFTLFQPLRRRVHGCVDRRCNRTRYDAARLVEAVATGLRDRAELETVRAPVVEVVDRAMAPASAALWVRAEAAP